MVSTSPLQMYTRLHLLVQPRATNSASGISRLQLLAVGTIATSSLYTTSATLVIHHIAGYTAFSFLVQDIPLLTLASSYWLLLRC